MNEKSNEITEWIIKADHDLGTAVVTYLHIPDFKDTITFHCQQSVEKCLKAYLVYLGISFRFTHDLIYLLELIHTKDASIDVHFDMVIQLHNYAVEIRYPNEIIHLTDENVLNAINTSKLIRLVICDKMKINIQYNDIIDENLTSR